MIAWCALAPPVVVFYGLAMQVGAVTRFLIGFVLAFAVIVWGEFMPDTQYLISEWGIATSAGVGAFFAIAPRLWE
jgi:hypothetical protein